MNLNQEFTPEESDLIDNALRKIEIALLELQSAKPESRSPLGRYVAIVITQLEIVIALIKTYLKG